MTVDGVIVGKMAIVLKELTMALSEYLGSVLPKLKPDRWWDEAVLVNLPSSQRQRVRQADAPKLSSLDLAALLRVFDANWWDLSNREALSPDCRHYLKELQSVRNRWAHAGADAEDRGTVYRDLDTVVCRALRDGLTQKEAGAGMSSLKSSVRCR